MMFPDCRNDDFYNEDFLTEKDREFIYGHDWCTEEVVDHFFDNLDIYIDEKDEEDPLKVLFKELPEDEKETEEVEWTFGDREPETREIRTYGDLLRYYLLHYIEINRDELITSIIDGMDEEEFNKIRKKVLERNKTKENPKEYYDTRKYMTTGQKEFREE